MHSIKPVFSLSEIPIQNWKEPEFEDNGLEVKVLRLDLIHPWVQGNKWFKLQPFLNNCLQQKKNGFLSMGGPYSNHLIALAFAARELGLKAVFYLRGQKQEWDNNPAVLQIRDWGAELIPTSRADFKMLHQSNFKEPIFYDSQDLTWVPMGGSSEGESEPLAGLGQWISNHVEFDFIALPAATAGTAAGLALGMPIKKKLLVVEVLKSQGGLEKDFWVWQGVNKPTVEWISDYHFGGYARLTPQLKTFCQRINSENPFQIEPIYSGKCFFAVSDLAKKGYFQEGNRILILHTGGIFPWNLALLGENT